MSLGLLEVCTDGELIHDGFRGLVGDNHQKKDTWSCVFDLYSKCHHKWTREQNFSQMHGINRETSCVSDMSHANRNQLQYLLLRKSCLMFSNSSLWFRFRRHSLRTQFCNGADCIQETDCLKLAFLKLILQSLIIIS